MFGQQDTDGAGRDARSNRKGWVGTYWFKWTHHSWVVSSCNGSFFPILSGDCRVGGIPGQLAKDTSEPEGACQSWDPQER